MNLTASVRTPNRKHYGTCIDLYVDGERVDELTVWLPRGRPSQLELSEYGITPDDWDADVEVDFGWIGVAPIKSEFPCDSHYQSEFELKLCEEIAERINHGGTR